VSDIKPPQDSLSSYFDDLLGTGEPREAVQPAATKIAAGVARVVAMPQKNASVPKAPPETKKLNLVPASEPRFSDPESHQSEEQKQKLERLLQSARTQLLIEPVTEPNLESKTETRIEASVAVARRPMTAIVRISVFIVYPPDWYKLCPGV
jgi:purine-binding chemotaxis protein CheW